jgi:signal transduction histidine kinase
LILTSTLINESLDELRLLSHRLLKQADERTDIVPLLQRESSRIAQLKICSVHFVTDCTSINMDTKLANTLLRIVQESIQNSLKHAQCKNISIGIESKQGPFTLCINDDGIGFDMAAAHQSSGIGLKSIKKRAGIIGAELVQISNPGKGTSTKVIFTQQNGLF